MKKFAVVLVLAAVLGVYLHLQSADSPAMRAYLDFAEAASSGRIAEAVALAGKPAVRNLLEEPGKRTKFCPDLLYEYRGLDPTIESETEIEGGVEIRSVVRVRYDPAGARSSVRGTMASEYRHQAVLAEKESRWRVVRFASSHLADFERQGGDWVEVSN